MKGVWLELPSTLIMNLWTQTKVIQSCTNTSAEAERQDSVEADRHLMESRIANLVTERSPM